MPGRLLNRAQKEKLLALVSQWFELMPPDPLRGGREQRFLGHTGALGRHRDANDARGGADAGNPVDHVHTIYRDLDRDHGGGLHGRPRSCRQAA